MQPVGICIEFGSVGYICDPQDNSVRIITKMQEYALFLKQLGYLYKAFSVHAKGASYGIETLPEVDLVERCRPLGHSLPS